MKSTFLSLVALVFMSSFAGGNAWAQTVRALPSVGGISQDFLNAKLPKVYNVGDAHWNYADAVGAGDQAYETLLNQGVGFYHVFHYIDATRAFHQAIALQPSAVLPRLGLALSIIKLASGDRDAFDVAYNEFIEAQTLLETNGGSVTETFWVEFFGAYLEGVLGVNLPRVDKADIRTFFMNYPLKESDIEYLVLGSNMLSDLNMISVQEVKQNYTKAIILNPKHVGGLHYMTHVAEALDEKTEALEFGRLAALYSPESSHIQHMYGHNLPIFGDWQEATDQFVIADQLHHTWAKDNKAPLTYDWHYTHNLFLWGYAQLGAGQDTDKALQTLVLSCKTEAHHCLSIFYAVVAYGDLAKAKEILQILKQEGKANEADFFQQTLYWLGLESGDGSGLQAAYNSPRSNFMYIVNEMLQGNEIPEALALQVQTALQTQLTRAGFDSWSQVLPMALLLKNVAEQKGNTKVQNAVAQVFQQINFRPQK